MGRVRFLLALGGVVVVEVWKKSTESPSYLVSSFGRVRGPKRILKPWLDEGGYPCVDLHSGKRKKRRKVHHLVLSAFVGPRPAGLEAAHLDGCRTNNKISNLKWVTGLENAQHKKIHGTEAIGEKHPGAKLTEKKVGQIRVLYESGDWTHRRLAHAFNVSKGVITNILARKIWRHIP